MKVVIKFILLLGIVAYLVWAIVQYARPVEKQVCAGVKIHVRDSISSDLVTEDYVYA